MTYDPGKDPAFPLPIGQPGPIGLTKREYFAGLILAGMCANSNNSSCFVAEFWDMPERAVSQADRLIETLAKRKNPPIDPEMEELRSEYAPIEQTLLGENGHE